MKTPSKMIGADFGNLEVRTKNEKEPKIPSKLEENLNHYKS